MMRAVKRALNGSLRVRLTVSIVSVLAMMLMALSVVLYVLFARALGRQFDQQLLGDSAAIAGMAEDEPATGGFEFESASLPEFERPSRPAYFQAWLDDGRVLARSLSLGEHDLARSSGHRAADPLLTDVVLPDGRAGRALQLRQPLRLEDESGVSGARPLQSDRFVTVVVARGTDQVAGTLASVRHWLFALAVLALLAASAASALAVARGLRPARALTHQVAQLGAGRLQGSLAVEDLPEELAPLGTKLNELFSRLHESFVREKRFTADVSHELRTPLAALRTMFEVALSRERTAPEYRAILDEAGAVVRQMQSLCENLLTLARLDAGRPSTAPREVELGALVDDCWRLFVETALQRGLTFRNAIAEGTVVTTDPEQLRVIVSNLLSNAATHTAPGGTIEIRPGPMAAPEIFLEVHDSGPPIPDEALPHLFERFFRGDPTRSDGVHYGIGLALVRGLSEALGFSVTASNTADGGVTFALSKR